MNDGVIFGASVDTCQGTGVAWRDSSWRPRACREVDGIAGYSRFLVRLAYQVALACRGWWINTPIGGGHVTDLLREGKVCRARVRPILELTGLQLQDAFLDGNPRGCAMLPLVG